MYNNNHGCGCAKQPCNLDPIYCPIVQQCKVNHNVCYQDICHPVNNHVHTVNTVVRRHFLVPTYSESQEVVCLDEYTER